MSIQIDGKYAVYDVAHAMEIRRTFLPPSNNLQLCNSYRSTVGPNPGKAYFLMTLQDLQALKAGEPAFHYADFRDDTDRGGFVRITQLIFLRATRFNPGFKSNALHLHIAEFADPRWLLRNPFYGKTVQRQFNVRAPAAAQTYYQDSTNAGTPWTWQGILDTLWNDMNQKVALNPSPQLPVTPDGTPENIQFLGVNAWDAYNQILARVGCVFSWDARKGLSTIANHVTQDQAYDAAAAANQGILIFDSNPIINAAAYTPSSVDVWNPYRRTQYGTEESTGWAMGAQEIVGSLAPTNVQAAPAEVNFPNTGMGLFDDLPALLDFNASITNTTALNNRAADRALDYYNTVLGPGTHPQTQIYSGIVSDDGLTIPRSYVSGVCWRESGHGYQTEIVRYAPWMPPDLIRFSDDTAYSPFGGMDLPAQAYAPPNIGRTTYPVYPPLSQPVQVTSTTAVTANVYPGQVQRGNPTAGPPPTLTGGETCWMWFPNGETVPANFVCPNARLCGAATLNGEGSPRPLYLCMAGGSGGASSWLQGGTSVAVAPSTVVYLTFATGGGIYWDGANGFAIPMGTPTQQYEVTCSCSFSVTDAAADFGVKFFLNGDTTLPTIFNELGSCNDKSYQMSTLTILTLNAGDTLRVGAYHNWLGHTPTVTSMMAKIKIVGG